MDDIRTALVAGDEKKLTKLVSEGLERGTAAVTILNDGLLVGMNKVGVLFRDGDIYLPEVLLAARAMKAATDLLAPLLGANEMGTRGTVVIGTVKGDLHDIGKNLVRIMLEGNGYKVLDLGSDVSPDAFVRAAIENEACAIAMSALLTTTMGAMIETVKALKAAEGAEGIKVIVGGAPVTEAYRKEIGADGYGASAPEGVDVLGDLLES